MNLTPEEFKLAKDSLEKAVERMAKESKEPHTGKQPGERQAVEIYGH